MFGSKKSALPDAAYEGDFEQVVKLVNSGADLNARVFGKYTALIWAATKGHDKIVSFLLNQEGIDVNAANAGGMTALMLACKEGHTEIVKGLIAYKDTNIDQQSMHGLTAIIAAAGMGRKDIVEILLKIDGISMDATYTDDKKHTPLSIARQNGHDEVVRILENFAASKKQQPPAPEPPHP